MFVKKEVRLEGNRFEGERADVMLEKLRANQGNPIIEDTVRAVRYQPKGYLRVVKKTFEEGIRSRQ